MGTALVIGVGSENGVGGAVCRRFAREGLHVVVAGRTEAKVSAVAESLRSSGARATHAVGDATRSEGVAGFFDAVERVKQTLAGSVQLADVAVTETRVGAAPNQVVFRMTVTVKPS